MAVKKTWMLLLIFFVLLGFSGVAGATLYDRGGGLIYDSVLDITWLQDANYAQTSGYDGDGLMMWANAVAWADNLVYAGYDDWRLPTTVDGLWVEGYDGTTTGGYNITSSEMGYMFYENLGNKGYYDTSGNYVGDGNWGLKNMGPFNNLQVLVYWSGTEYSLGPDVAWDFVFGDGGQYGGGKDFGDYSAWAVRPGDVSAPVPEPATMLLLASGLAGLGAFRKRIGRRRG